MVTSTIPAIPSRALLRLALPFALAVAACSGDDPAPPRTAAADAGSEAAPTGGDRAPEEPVRNADIVCSGGEHKFCKQDECACFRTCREDRDCGEGSCCTNLQDNGALVCFESTYPLCARSAADASADAPGD